MELLPQLPLSSSLRCYIHSFFLLGKISSGRSSTTTPWLPVHLLPYPRRRVSLVNTPPRSCDHYFSCSFCVEDQVLPASWGKIVRFSWGSCLLICWVSWDFLCSVRANFRVNIPASVLIQDGHHLFVFLLSYGFWFIVVPHFFLLGYIKWTLMSNH